MFLTWLAALLLAASIAIEKHNQAKVGVNCGRGRFISDPAEQRPERRAMRVVPLPVLLCVPVWTIPDLCPHDRAQRRLRWVFPRQPGYGKLAAAFAPSAQTLEEVGAADQISERYIVLRH
jgi:hypothetical protein